MNSFHLELKREPRQDRRNKEKRKEIMSCFRLDRLELLQEPEYDGTVETLGTAV